jgi:hypothetical protein
MVYGAGRLYAGDAFDSRDDLPDQRRGVRHPDAAWAEHRGGGDWDDGIPELFGRDVRGRAGAREPSAGIGPQMGTRRAWVQQVRSAPRFHVMRGA